MEKNLENLLACVSDKCKQLATSKRFGLDKYLLCLNCFSSSNSCWDVNAVRGRLVLPNIACCICRPPENEKKSTIKTLLLQVIYKVNLNIFCLVLCTYVCIYVCVYISIVCVILANQYRSEESRI